MSHHLAVVCLAFDFLIAPLHLSLPPLSDHKNSPHFAGLLEILADFHEPFGIEVLVVMASVGENWVKMQQNAFQSYW